MSHAGLQFTARMISISRKIGIARRRRRMPRQAIPKVIERDYARRLIALVQIAREALQPLIQEAPALVASARSARQDMVGLSVVFIRRYDAGEGRRVRLLADRARESLRGSIQPDQLERLTEEFAKKSSHFNREQLKRQTKAALGVDVLSQDTKLGTMIEHFISENVALIKGLPVKLIDDVENTVLRGVTSGTLTKDLAADIEEQFGVSERRATLIARDQIGKFYGQVNAARQQELGVHRFIWRTVGDERVRDEHRDREAESEKSPYSYDDPPDGELPGEPINCRCYAEPVFSDILDEVA